MNQKELVLFNSNNGDVTIDVTIGNDTSMVIVNSTITTI